MEKLLTETLEFARKNFKEFGFEDQQIVSLLSSGKNDLTKELNKLQQLLENDPIDIAAVNLSLHALKGLFLTMGNSIVADQLNELHQETNNVSIISKIKSLLGF